MNARSCKRLWEVEAARDGRLSGRALAAFEEHAAACRDCRTERRALDALQRRLTDDATPLDEISLRRQREKILAEADSGLRNPPSGARRGRIAGLAVACAVAASIGWTAMRPKAEPARTSPIASLVASPGARWERHRTQGREQITLADGVLSLSVHRSASDPQVSVRVPDGEIEDVGTSFRVTVQGEQTREIVVHAGSVVFRQHGRAPLLLASPSVWVAPTTGVDAPAEAAKPAEPPVVPPAPPTKPHTENRTRERHKVDAAPAASSEATPADEDLSYLNIVALMREGRVEEARVAAGAYLRRFPNGFRRDEVLALVRERR